MIFFYKLQLKSLQLCNSVTLTLNLKFNLTSNFENFSICLYRALPLQKIDYTESKTTTLLNANQNAQRHESRRGDLRI